MYRYRERKKDFDKYVDFTGGKAIKQREKKNILITDLHEIKNKIAI